MHSKLRPSPAMVVALIGLFVSLGGTAAALSGSNTVFSDDITDNQVYSADVRNDTLTSGGLAAVDLRPNSVAQSEIAANGVAASEIANGAVGTAELSNSIPAVKATRTTDQSISSNLSAALNLDAELYDTANMHDNATNNDRLTAPVAGIYEVSAHVEWTSNTSGLRELLVYRIPGGGGAPALVAEDLAPGSLLNVQDVTTPVKLAQGDYVRALVFQTSGTNLSVKVVEEASPEFSMTWLAPGP